MPQKTKKTLIASIGEIQHDLSLYLEKIKQRKWMVE